MSIQKKMSIATLWAIVERGGQQAISFLVFLVIARFVGPEEYGMAMLCFIYLSATNLLLSSLAESIVVFQIKDRERLSMLFGFTMITGIILSVLCFTFSEFAAKVLGDIRIGSLLRYLSLVPILIATISVPQLIVLRELDFKIYAIRSLCASIGSGVIGITLAYYGAGAYALIFQQIVLYFIANIVLWAFIDWRPQWIFNRKLLIDTIKPGFNLMGSNFVSVCEEQVPRVIIASILDTISVGFYTFAYRMTAALKDILIMPSISTLYPALAKLNNDINRQKELIGHMIFLIGFIVVPTLSFASITAPIYITLFFSDKWSGSTQLLQLLLIMGCLSPFINIVRVICRSHNCVGAFFKLQSILVATLLICLLFLTPYGLTTVGYGMLFFTAITIPIYFIFLSKYLKFSLWEQIHNIFASSIATIGMLLTVKVSITILDPIFTWLSLFVIILIGIISFIFFNLLLQRKRLFSVYKFVSSLTTSKQ
ncbi:oligosaccharide flippase family protein [Desulfovibrio sp. UCD-KL4C]|uniref:oligosaccharide flippase family protein n=1 Tax=Desulfovibrio sp. UCD-KL4C TaxID=2578120 RepID=UPI0025C54C1C|nr:oligosaccharide flippase family protein [Desulfovibrio sp. UCD-KL4C]